MVADDVEEEFYDAVLEEVVQQVVVGEEVVQQVGR